MQIASLPCNLILSFPRIYQQKAATSDDPAARADALTRAAAAVP